MYVAIHHHKPLLKLKFSHPMISFQMLSQMLPADRTQHDHTGHITDAASRLL